MLISQLVLCEQAAKTAEKLALNIIEFLLTSDEIQNCTVNGNKQFHKRPLDYNKKKALQSKFVPLHAYAMDKLCNFIVEFSEPSVSLLYLKFDKDQKH